VSHFEASDTVVRHLAERLALRERELEGLRVEVAAWRSRNKAAFSNSRLLAASSMSRSSSRTVSVTSKLPPASLITAATWWPAWRYTARLSSTARVTLRGVMWCSWL